MHDTQDFNIYATCNRTRRKFIFDLLGDGNTISPDQYHSLAERFNCNWRTIYYDVCLFEATYDDIAFNAILKRKWSAQDQRAKRYNVKNTLTLDELKSIFEAACGKCQECGRDVGRQYLVPDHIISMSLGGPNSAGNIKVLCGMCNLQKTRKTQPPEEAKNEMEGKYITTQEAATELAELRNHPNPYTVRWIQSLIDRGKIIAKKFGRDWMVNEVSLKAYAKRKGHRGAPPQKDHVTIAQAAAILGITPSAVYERIKTGKLNSVEINGYIYVHENELGDN